MLAFRTTAYHRSFTHSIGYTSTIYAAVLRAKVL